MVSPVWGTMCGQIRTHTWGMGPLTWTDFVHKPAIADCYSYLEYYMGIDDRYHEKDGVLYRMPEAYAYVSPDFSWADTHYRSESLLRYNQVAFGLLEVYRREMQKTVLESSFIDGQQLVNNTMHRLEDEMDQLEYDCAQGSDTSALQRWETDVRQRLEVLAPVDLYRHVDAPYRWALTMDIGYAGMGGDLHHYFRNGLSFGFYYDLEFWHNALIFGVSGGSSRVLADALNTRYSDNDLYIGDHLSVLDIFLAYGYSVVDNTRFRVTPFMGYGMVGVFYTPDAGSSVGPTTGAIHLGVDFNYHISNQVEWFPVGRKYNAVHDLFSFNAKAFVTYDRFATIEGAPRGFTYNLQLGFGFTSGKARCQ